MHYAITVWVVGAGIGLALLGVTKWQWFLLFVAVNVVGFFAWRRWEQ